MKRDILIVDDDRNLRGTLQEVFEGAGYLVREAANAREAGELIVSQMPDLSPMRLANADRRWRVPPPERV